MHLEQINYFLTLARVLNFTKTAEMLYVTQPTISRQIRLMEDELGLALFYRTANTINLTPAGSILYEKLSQGYKTIQDGIEEAMTKTGQKKGTLRVGSAISIDYDDFLAHCYSIFSANYPDVEFIYEKADFLILREKLETGELDVIFTLLSKPYHASNASTISLFEGGGVLLHKKNDPRKALSKSKGNFSPFTGDCLVCLKEEFSARGIDGLDRICESIGFKYSRAIRVPNLESVFFYVQTGLGVSILDKSVPGIRNEMFEFTEIPHDVAKLTGAVAYLETNPNPWIASLVDIVSKEKYLIKNKYL